MQTGVDVQITTFKKDRSYLDISDKFVYEICKYLKDGSILSLDDLSYLESDKFLEDSTKYDKKSKILTITTLYSAPLSWIKQMGYEEVPIDIDVKKRFKKK